LTSWRMNRNPRRAWIVLSLALVAAVPASSQSTATSRAEGTLTVRSLLPPTGSKVDKKTTLVAEIDYEITSAFVPGHFFIMAVAQTTGDRSTGGHFPEGSYPVLKTPKGSVTFRFPLKWLSGEKDLTQVLQVSFLLNQKTDGVAGARGPSRVIMRSGPHEFPR
jgi:hypothetical protein